MEKIKEYTNGEVTVVWKPERCIHSEKCWRGLPSVFNPKERPWVKIDGADTDAIIAQVRKCPSGALSTYMNDENASSEAIEDEQIVEVIKDGPLMVYGNIKVKHPEGSEASKHKVTAFCRCGGSGNKPFCDGSHKKLNFTG